MKIRARFNLIFTLLATIVLIFFGATIYWVSKNNREKEFYTVLKKEALIKANLLIETSISTNDLHKIYAYQNKTSNTISITIYDFEFNRIYSDKSIEKDKDSIYELLQKIKSNYEFEFRDKTKQSIGISFKKNGDNFIVLASGTDLYGQRKLYELLYFLILAAIISILILHILGFYFSKRVLNPITEMTKEINKITAAHLDLRLKPLKYKGELNKLGDIFNQMLDRLESSFESQKEFVAHISHELRTPLAAIITDLELALNHAKSSEEYRKTIERSLADAKKIVRLSNNLLDLAKANYDPIEIGYTSLRMDEILLEAYQEIQMGTEHYSVQMEFVEDTISEELMTVKGNPYLLKVACKNLIENACKFSSDHHCLIRIGFTEKMVKLDFIDNGIGINDEDLELILTPFYRGKNQTEYEGYGIGLALTQKILLQHNGKLEITTVLNQGSTFSLYIPHIEIN